MTGPRREGPDPSRSCDGGRDRTARPATAPSHADGTAHRQLRILFVYDCVYPESLGGVEHRNYRLAEALARRGHEVTIAGWCEAQPSRTGRINVLPMRLRRPLYNRAGKRSALTSVRFAMACLLLPVGRFDVVETANIPYIHVLALALRCRLSGRPLVVSWHEYWGRYWSSYVGRVAAPIFRAVEWTCAQLGVRACADSELTAGRLRSRRHRRCGVELVPCGISVQEATEAAREVPKNGSPLVYAGRLMREKRLELLIEAVARMRATDRRPILTVIGDGPYRASLEALVNELSVSDRIEFRGRLPTATEVWREMARSLLAVQPSSREGFGMFPLEAMALGLPVIYCETTESAVSWLVRDGIDGVCTPPEPEALAAAIDRLVLDPALRTELSASARMRAAAFDWEEIGRKMESLFLSSIDKMSARSAERNIRSAYPI